MGYFPLIPCAMTCRKCYNDIQSFPAYLSGLSCALLLIQAAKGFFSPAKTISVRGATTTSHFQNLQRRVHALGLRLFLFRVARLVTCLALTVLFVLDPPQNTTVGVWIQLTFVGSGTLLFLHLLMRLAMSRHIPVSWPFFRL